jgi:hypothetical protein
MEANGLLAQRATVLQEAKGRRGGNDLAARGYRADRRRAGQRQRQLDVRYPGISGRIERE